MRSTVRSIVASVVRIESEIDCETESEIDSEIRAVGMLARIKDKISLARSAEDLAMLRFCHRLHVWPADKCTVCGLPYALLLACSKSHVVTIFWGMTQDASWYGLAVHPGKYNGFSNCIYNPFTSARVPGEGGETLKPMNSEWCSETQSPLRLS